MLVAFDMHETLLDLSVLDQPFRETFGLMRCVVRGSLRCCNCRSWVD